MSRLINLVLFLAVLTGAIWLYQVKHEAKEAEEKIVALEKQIADEREALLLLKAEWSYLNRPQRVQQLTDRFSEELELKQVEPHQIGEVADLPERAATPSDATENPETLDALLKAAQPAQTTAQQGAGQ